MQVPTFEHTYPKAPFAELIRIGIAVGQLYARWRDKGEDEDVALPTQEAMSR